MRASASSSQAKPNFVRASSLALSLSTPSVARAHRQDAGWRHFKARQAQLGAVDYAGLPLSHHKLEPFALSAFTQAPVLLDGENLVPLLKRA